MISFPVHPDKQKNLQERMDRLGILEEDFEEQFVRSSGRGGQKLNKTSSCVSLLHKPTNTLVKCQKSRSQAMNRFYARRRLVEILEDQRTGGQARVSLREKIRRQKDRKRRRAKKKANPL